MNHTIPISPTAREVKVLVLLEDWKGAANGYAQP